MLLIHFMKAPLNGLSPESLASYYNSLDNDSKIEILSAGKICSEFFSHAVDANNP